MKARTVSGYIRVEGLGDIAEAFDYLGKYAFADALQTALNETAQDAVERMEAPFAAAIEGGPVPFTKIKPGKRSNSVVARTQKGATKSAKDYARVRENGLMVGDERWDPERSDTSHSIMKKAIDEETEERRQVEAAAQDNLRLRG